MTPSMIDSVWDSAMGLSIYSTFKLLQVVLLLANFLSIYLVAKAIFRDRVQAQVTAIAYTFSFYAMLDIYYRAAIGECFAFIFLPVVYLGYYRITHGREDQWWLMALGMTAIALSHTLSIILGVIFLRDDRGHGLVHPAPQRGRVKG